MQGPIIIGGIGGSGTRVVVSILQAFNVYFGDDLNIPLDNLSYTLLFKRPKWFNKNQLNNQKIKTGLSILEKSMLNRKSYTLREIAYLLNATISMARHGHNMEKDGQGQWAFERLKCLIFNNSDTISMYKYWGWKEPNSHLLLKNFHEYFADFKYIHTIRHGLDMAFSTNQEQFYNWANLYGVDIPKKEEDIPAAVFSYWVKANRKVLNMQNEFGHDTIYVLDFDKLCLNPEQEIKRLTKFLHIEIKDDELDLAKRIPSIPKTKDRYKGKRYYRVQKRGFRFS